MKVILSFVFERTWWRLFYLLYLSIPDEGYSIFCIWAYLMKIILSFVFERTWWRLLQKSVLYTKLDVYIFISNLQYNVYLFVYGVSTIFQLYRGGQFYWWGHILLIHGWLHVNIFIMQFIIFLGPSWSWLYSSWIYNYLCNQSLSPIKLRVRTPFMARCNLYNIMW
jgi:hypothetical protein